MTSIAEKLEAQKMRRKWLWKGVTLQKKNIGKKVNAEPQFHMMQA